MLQRMENTLIIIQMEMLEKKETLRMENFMVLGPYTTIIDGNVGKGFTMKEFKLGNGLNGIKTVRRL